MDDRKSLGMKMQTNTVQVVDCALDGQFYTYAKGDAGEMLRPDWQPHLQCVFEMSKKDYLTKTST